MESFSQYLANCESEGIAAAESHFSALIAAAQQALPEEQRQFFPLKRSDISGCFVASTTKCSISVVTGQSLYYDIEAGFEYDGDDGDKRWKFIGYLMTLPGPLAFLGLPNQIKIERFSDALLASRFIKQEELRQRNNTKTASPGQRVN